MGITCLLLVLTGCDGAAGEPCSPAAPEGPTAPEVVAADDPPTGAVAGRLVHANGLPIEGLRMLACTASICYWDETDSDGRFLVTNLTLEPLKMQTGDPNAAHVDVLFYHLLDTTEVSELPRDVIVPLKDQEPAPWAEGGGAVTLADGALTLSAEADALTYPPGTKDKAVTAYRLAGDDLPPFDWAPWEGREAETFGFVINPLGIEAEPGVSVRVDGVSEVPCGAYRIWSVASKTGSLTHVGTGTVVATEGGSLTLTSEVGSEPVELSTLIISPL